ncbi:unnamed protein product [Cladocopium goreaui]|uniref:Uncharacterized protein n=1 Tax=Cladocopium goreaui TaxID=2562237 RepID=A0A9P1CMU5_9DINO|nr:unnamed protein product [Cladocopium goreaui]
MAALCMKDKSKHAKPLDDNGVRPKLLQQHFRDCMNPLGWYSLPVDLFTERPMRPLEDAVAFAILGHTSQSLLPVADKANTALPLSDRERIQKDSNPSVSQEVVPFLAIQDSEAGSSIIKKPNLIEVIELDSGSDNEVGACDAQPSSSSTAKLVPSAQSVPQCMPQDMLSRDMVRFAANSSGLIVFRVSDKRPALKKRPLSFADSLTTDDVCIRICKVENANPQSVTVSAVDHPTVPLVKLFAGANTEELVESMLQWTHASRLHHSMNIQPSSVGESEFSLIEEVAGTCAVVGASTHYDIAGMTSEAELATIDNLVNKSILVRTKHGQSVQLAPSVFSCQLVLTLPRPVFEQRLGSSFQLDRLNLKPGNRPTQWELYVNLCKTGWVRENWQESTAKLKREYVQPGMEKKFYQDTYWYWLCLLNCDALHALGFTLYHGQLEAFYQAAIQLAKEDPDKLAQLEPGSKADVYKKLTKHLQSTKASASETQNAAAGFLTVLDFEGSKELAPAASVPNFDFVDVDEDEQAKEDTGGGGGDDHSESDLVVVEAWVVGSAGWELGAT